MPGHRYVEVISLAAMLAAKRLAGVTPEVNLMEYVTCTHQPNANKAAYSAFENQRRHHKNSKTGVSVAPQKGRMSSKFFFKKWSKCPVYENLEKKKESTSFLYSQLETG